MDLSKPALMLLNNAVGVLINSMALLTLCWHTEVVEWSRSFAAIGVRPSCITVQPPHRLCLCSRVDCPGCNLQHGYDTVISHLDGTSVMAHL